MIISHISRIAFNLGERRRGIVVWLSSQIMYPCIVSASRQVSQVVAVRIGLALETDVHVGFVVVAILEKTYDPFDDVDDIEWYKEKFSLLRSMDALMINYVNVNPRGICCPD